MADGEVFLAEYQLVTDKGLVQNNSKEYTGPGKATYPNGDTYDGHFANGVSHQHSFYSHYVHVSYRYVKVITEPILMLPKSKLKVMMQQLQLKKFTLVPGSIIKSMALENKITSVLVTTMAIGKMVGSTAKVS